MSRDRSLIAVRCVLGRRNSLQRFPCVSHCSGTGGSVGFVVDQTAKPSANCPISRNGKDLANEARRRFAAQVSSELSALPRRDEAAEQYLTLHELLKEWLGLDLDWVGRRGLYESLSNRIDLHGVLSDLKGCAQDVPDLGRGSRAVRHCAAHSAQGRRTTHDQNASRFAQIIAGQHGPYQPRQRMDQRCKDESPFVVADGNPFRRRRRNGQGDADR